jgi:lipopolysaccharide heptosyltransferase I
MTRRTPVAPIPIERAPERILIVKPSAIGDIVHALPVLNLIRRRWPAAHISWLVTPACAALVEGHPQIDQVLCFDRKGMSRAWRSPIAALKLLGLHDDMRSQNVDLVVDLQGLFRSGWFAGQTRSPLRVGFANAREFGWLFYTHRVESSWEDHAVDRYLCIAEALGLDISRVEFHFAVNDRDRAEIRLLLSDSEPYAVLLPGANWDTKRWPPERFAALVEPIRERFGLRCVVAGGPGDCELAAKIPGAQDLTGKTNLRQLIALLEGAKLVIAGDTGPMHIAAALGKPLVTMYGPTDPILTGPFGRLDTVIRVDIPCSPCFSRKCSHQSCLQWLGTEPVLALAQRQLSRAGAAGSVTL